MTSRERDLVRIVVEQFSAMLGLEDVDVDSDFFELGGHSLMAVRLVARLREHAAIRLTVQDVFEAPTPAALTARAVGSDGSGDAETRR